MPQHDAPITPDTGIVPARIAVLSDIHGNLPALEAVVADAKARGCTAFANLGDILSGPLWPRETAAFLMPLGWPTIAGNHERQVLDTAARHTGPSDAFVRAQCTPDQLAWLAALPATMTLPGAWCTHAQPGCDDAYLLETAEGDGVRDATEAEIEQRLRGERHPLILVGHSHLAKIVTLADGRRIANPGSVGLPAYEMDEPHPHFVSAGTRDACYMILEAGEVSLHAVPYDVEAAARRAEAQGSKWARYLREGLAR